MEVILGKGYSAKASLELCAHVAAGEGKKQNGEAEKVAQGRATKEGWKSGLYNNSCYSAPTIMYRPSHLNS